MRLASMANSSNNPNIARQAYDTSQFAVNRANNVATGRLPNTYTPYDSNGNPYGYFNSSRQEGKTPSPDAPRVEEVAEENIGYCEKLVQKAQVLYSLYSFAILNQQIFASGNEAAFLRNYGSIATNLVAGFESIIPNSNTPMANGLYRIVNGRIEELDNKFGGNPVYELGQITTDLAGIYIDISLLKGAGAAAKSPIIIAKAGDVLVFVGEFAGSIKAVFGVASVADAGKNAFRLIDDVNSIINSVERNREESLDSSELVFGSDTKSTQKLHSQMQQRGWTEETVKKTVDNPYTTRKSVNKSTGNSATVFYTEQGSYVIVDDITKEIVQISDNINPSTWIPDSSIINPYIP